MRKELINVATLADAFDVAPWASEIIKVTGGFIAFESIVDARIWDAQK